MFIIFMLLITLGLPLTNCEKTLDSNINCPQGCTCLDNSYGQITLTCSVKSDWDTLCISISQYKNNTDEDINLKLIGDSEIFFTSVGCLPLLMNLDLSATLIALSPHMFQTLNVNSWLNVSGNGLTHVPEMTFDGISHVNSLDLSHNSIQSLDKTVFYGVEDVKRLDLSYNNISFIHSEAFANLSQLEFLNLAANHLHKFSFRQFSPSVMFDVLNLSGNSLKSLYLQSNETGTVPLHSGSIFDISGNAIECSCNLAYFLEAMPFSVNSLANVESTVCDSPDNFKGQSIALLDSSGLACIAPDIFMSYPTKQKDLLRTSSITLECHAEGFPDPSIIWITPWGDHFLYNEAEARLPDSLIQNLEINRLEIKSLRRYESNNIAMITSIKALSSGDLVISNIRGYMGGNYVCMAFNPAGNMSKSVELSVYCGIKSTYTYSLILSGYCASGFLIIGFLVGFVRMLVVCLRHRLYFIVPVQSKTPSTTHHPDICNVSVTGTCSSMIAKPRSGCGDALSITSCLNLPGPLERVLEEVEDENLNHNMSEGEQSPPVLDTGSPSAASAARQRRIRETIEEARGRLRDGMERKMDRVRKNVQHIRESGTLYVHNIRESGSQAANRMRAGVALGVETVKCHMQSFKELCGTGDMGTNTTSMISVETDVDSHQQSEVVKQVTTV